MCKKTTVLEFHLTMIIDSVEVVHYLKQVFQLLKDKSVTAVEALFYFPIIIYSCMIR